MKKLALHIFAIAFAAMLSSPASANDTTGTSLQEYAAMDARGQRNVIFKERRRIYEEAKQNYIENGNPQEKKKAGCVAHLFDLNSNDGNLQLGVMKEFLNRVHAEGRTSSAETFVKYLIENHFCPNPENDL